MILMFNQFKGIKHEVKVKQVLENQSKRCKIQAIKLFQPSGNWKIDRWWSHDEKVHLGIEEEVEVLDIETLIANIEQTKNDLQINIDILKKIETQDNNLLSKIIYKEIKLNEVIDFSVNTNTSRFTKSFVNEHKGDIPVYSASKNPDDVSYGYVADELPNVRYFEDCMTWNIDGSIGEVFIRKGKFSLSEKVIPLVLFEQYKTVLDKKYLKYIIQKEAKIKEFGFSDKAGKYQLRELLVRIPVNKYEEFDLDLQKYLADKYEVLENNKKDILNKFNQISNLDVTLDKDDTES